MNSIYITSVERYSGKTALSLGLGKRFQADGFTVGYVKPLSLQPWMVEGHVADEDAGFVKEILGLEDQPWELSPVVLTPEFLQEHLTAEKELNLMEEVKNACQKAGSGKDILLLEGGGSLREGYVVGLPTPAVAAELGSDVISIVKYRDEIRLIDDALAARTRLGDQLAGVIINRVPESANNFVSDTAVPFLKRRGIRILGILPEERSLASLTVQELADALDAEVLAESTRREPIVESLMVGAMSAEAALSRFRKQPNKAVITGGDRTDIQLAALETSTTALILTGNLHPSPLVVRQAKEFGVAVLLVSTNTMETVDIVDRIFGKTRLGQPSKLQHFQDLLNKKLDFKLLYETLGLAKS